MRKLKPSRNTARKVLTAGLVLEIYAGGGGYTAVQDEMGTPRHKHNGSAMNAEELLAWAIEAYLSDDAKRVGAARVTAEFARIAFATSGHKIADRFRALENLKAIYGLGAERGVSVNFSGVIEVPPQTSSVDEWAAKPREYVQ